MHSRLAAKLTLLQDWGAQHFQKTCSSCGATSTLSSSPAASQRCSPRAFFINSTFSTSLITPHLGTSHSPQRVPRPAAPPSSLQTRAAAFGAAPLSSRTPVFGTGRKGAAGAGRALDASAGCRPSPAAGAGPAPGDVRRPQRLRGAVTNCPRKSPPRAALRRLFF